jgi:hypothetical protein
LGAVQLNPFDQFFDKLCGQIRDVGVEGGKQFQPFKASALSSALPSSAVIAVKRYAIIQSITFYD